MASQAEVIARTEAAAMWQARAEMLAMQLEQAQHALEAPKAAETLRGARTTAEADSEAPTRP